MSGGVSSVRIALNPPQLLPRRCHRVYVDDVLSPRNIRTVSIFSTTAVNHLVQRARGSEQLSETDSMALAGVISTQLVNRLFVSDFQRVPPLGGADDVKVCFGGQLARTTP